MHIDSTNATSALIQEGLQQIATLRKDVAEAHVAEHIRGMVATTLGQIPGDSSDSVRKSTEHWQDWALGVADGLTLPVTD